MNNIILFVEHETDAEVVKNIFIRLNVYENIEIKPVNGKQNVLKSLQKFENQSDIKVAGLIDSDELFIADTRKKMQNEFVEKNIHLFFAVPCIEAWLFADDELALKQIKTDYNEYVLRRLPLPDDIPFPKDLASRLFGNYYGGKGLNVDFLQKINLSKAVSRSPSLRDFLLGITELMSVPNQEIANAVNTSFDLQIIANLLKEELNSDTIIFKSMDGRTITVGEMEKNIVEGNELGKAYAADLLRVSRDFLKRKANPRKVV
jgi:hypothetical protein